MPALAIGASSPPGRGRGGPAEPGRWGWFQPFILRALNLLLRILFQFFPRDLPAVHGIGTIR